MLHTSRRRRLTSPAAAAVLSILAATALALRPAPAPRTAATRPRLAAGVVLVASAQVPDPRFFHAVVLIIDVDAQGAAGLLLNQPDPQTPVAKLFPAILAAQSRTEAAFHGGPVEAALPSPRLFCLLRASGPFHEARQILPGLWATTSLPLMQLAFQAQTPPTALRVFQGYTGWTRAQINRELAGGLWTVHPGSAALAFDPDPETLWQRLSTNIR